MLNLIAPLIESNKLYRCLAYLSCGSYIGAPGSSRPGPYRSNGPRIQEAWEPRARSRRGPWTSRTRDARRVRQETRLGAVLGHIGRPESAAARGRASRVAPGLQWPVAAHAPPQGVGARLAGAHARPLQPCGCARLPLQRDVRHQDQEGWRASHEPMTKVEGWGGHVVRGVLARRVGERRRGDQSRDAFGC